MDDVIIQLGYVAIFVGTFLEGESILALGGLAAEHGYLSFPVVVAVAVLGVFSATSSSSLLAGAMVTACWCAFLSFLPRYCGCRHC